MSLRARYTCRCTACGIINNNNPHGRTLRGIVASVKHVTCICGSSDRIIQILGGKPLSLIELQIVDTLWEEV